MHTCIIYLKTILYNIFLLDDDDIIRLIQPVINRIERVEHIKIMNYIENVVRNYIENDFIMHFRLSRNVAYELVERFSVSEVYQSLQGNGL